MEFANLVLKWVKCEKPVASDAVILRETHGKDATLSMQAVTVLAHELLQKAPVLKLNQRHMGRGGKCLQGVDGLGRALFPLRSQCPNPFWASEVGYAWGEGEISLSMDAW